MERSKGCKVLDEAFLTTPITANILPGNRGVVELRDVVDKEVKHASYPKFRHNDRYAEMVTGDLVGAFEAPLFEMIAVAGALDGMDWSHGEKPEVRLNGQP